MVKKFLVLIALVFILGACGRKTPPFSIEESIPKKFSFEVKPVSTGFELFINLPTMTRAGYPLTKIKKLIVKKEIFSPAGKLIDEEEIKLSPHLHSAANTYFFLDSKVKSGLCYRYSVKVVKDFLVKTEFLTGRLLCWQAPPPPPQDFKVFKKDSTFELSWKGVKGASQINYQVRRFLDGKEKIFVVKENFLKDAPEFKNFLCYSVRATVNYRGTLIPGDWSRELCFYKE